MTPRYGKPPQPNVHYRRRPGAYAILLREGQILLTFQQAPEPEFQLPGGGIERGEDPIPALHREVLEETGWTISPPQYVGAYRRYVYMPEYDLQAEKFCTIWLARPATRRGPPTETGHSAHWMPARQALSLIPDPGAAVILRDVLDRIG